MSEVDFHHRIAGQIGERVLIKADEATLLREAHALVEAARAEAEQLRQQARQDADAITAQADARVAEAAERGYREGVERGLAEQARQHALRESQSARRMTTLDERIGALVMRTLSTILTDREHDERFFGGVMQRVLRAARDEKFLTVRVCAEQYEAARTAIERLVSQTGAAPFIEVVRDADLKRGACIVESAHGVIDASLDTQLEAISAALTTAWRPDERGAASDLAAEDRAARAGVGMTGPRDPAGLTGLGGKGGVGAGGRHG